MLRMRNRAVLNQSCRTARISRSHLRPGIRIPRLIRHDCSQSRTFVEIPTVLLPPVVFSGLLITLWMWKCLMMVVFQNKIIYMPGLPPNARRETIAAYKNQSSGILWREERIKASDGTLISLCVASVDNGSSFTQAVKTIYILYFQGHSPSFLAFT